jgi:hypothetical protein
MITGSSATVSMIATALVALAPGDGISTSGIADFLTTIGGDTALKTSGSMLSDPSPQLYPLARDKSEIIDYRFFAEKLAANGSATGKRAQAAFAKECAVKGGHIEPENGKVARSFQERVLGRRLPPRGIFKHFWSGLSAVCARSSSEVMGGFVAITFDNTELAPRAISAPGCSARSRSWPPAPLCMLTARIASERLLHSRHRKRHYVPAMLPSRGRTRPSDAILLSAPRQTAAP